MVDDTAANSSARRVVARASRPSVSKVSGCCSNWKRTGGTPVPLLPAENPLGNRLGFGVGHHRERRHDDGSPFARPALLDLVRDLRVSIGIMAILGGDVFVRRSHFLCAEVVATQT